MRDLFLVIHFIGIAMSVGTGFANLFLGSAAAKMEPAERANFMGKTTVLMKMGQTGLILLILSGGYLMTPYWKALSDMPTLIAKLSFFVLLLIMVTIIHFKVLQSKRENNPALLAKLKPLGMINFFVGISILILAVLTFH